MIDGFATERHYMDHLLPVVEAVGGRMLCGSNALLQRARALAPNVESLPGIPRKPGRPVLVAGFTDAKRVGKDRRLGLLEHGAGQTYTDALADPHYPGGLGWENCALILTPGPHAAAYWHPRLAGTHTALVELHGTPRLDRYSTQHGLHADLLRSLAQPIHPCDCLPPDRLPPPTAKHRENCPNHQPSGAAGGTGGTPPNARGVGVSFHWDCRVCPETKATWREWLPEVTRLSEVRPVLATAHPRAWRMLAGAYAARGIPASQEFTDLVDSCWLFICDNSSAMYEWAGLGRPVLCLQGAQYRRDAGHGLRFYDATPGPLVWPSETLAMHVERAEGDGYAECMEYAGVACEAAYGLPRFDGLATERAAAAIREHLA